MADKQNYAPPTSPPPNYNNPKPTEHHDAGPYYPPNPTASPAPNGQNQMSPYGQQGGDMMRAPDPAYGGGYYNNQGPPPQGFYGPGGNQGGYYGQPGQQGPPQGMYYQQQPGPMYGQQPVGYYQEDRRGGSGSGICAGIMGALACCCCLDILF